MSLGPHWRKRHPACWRSLQWDIHRKQLNNFDCFCAADGQNGITNSVVIRWATTSDRQRNNNTCETVEKKISMKRNKRAHWDERNNATEWLTWMTQVYGNWIIVRCSRFIDRDSITGWPSVIDRSTDQTSNSHEMPCMSSWQAMNLNRIESLRAISIRERIRKNAKLRKPDSPVLSPCKHRRNLASQSQCDRVNCCELHRPRLHSPGDNVCGQRSCSRQQRSSSLYRPTSL